MSEPRTRMYSVRAVVESLGVFDEVDAEYDVGRDVVRLMCLNTGRPAFVFDMPNENIATALRDDRLELEVMAVVVRHFMLREPDLVLMRLAARAARQREHLAAMVAVIERAGGYMRAEDQAAYRAAREELAT